MECGASDFVCHAIQLIAENEYLAGGIAEQLGKYWETSGGTAGVIANLLRDFGQLAVGIIGGAFGFYRYWIYRERILHERLVEYLSEQDVRLSGAGESLLASIQRPSPGQRFADPIFAPKELRSVLRERRWHLPAVKSAVAWSALKELEIATKSINNRIAASERSLQSHREQLATAHLAQGAIKAIAAELTTDRRWQDRKKLNIETLDHLRQVQEIGTPTKWLEAQELEAHQLRKLGNFDAADKVLSDLIASANRLPIPKSRDLRVARWKRYRAELAQIKKLLQHASDSAGSSTKASGIAYRLLMTSDPSNICVIELFERHAGKLSEWEQFEKAETHYLVATIADLRGFTDIRDVQLSLARTEYNQVLARTSKPMIGMADPFKTLRDKADCGLERLDRAEAGKFDIEWLIPPIATTPQTTLRTSPNT